MNTLKPTGCSNYCAYIYLYKSYNYELPTGPQIGEDNKA